MKYILERYSFLLNESKLIFDDSFTNDLMNIMLNIKDVNIRKHILDILNKNSKQIDDRRLRKDSYKVSVGDKPNMVKIGDIEMKIGRFITLISPNIPDHIKSEIVNLWKVNQDFENRGKFILVDKNIDRYYKCGNYKKISGSLGNSCMNNLEKSRFDIYNENKNIKLLVLLDDYDNVLGRSIIFNTIEHGMVMSRIYVIDDTDISTFKKYAKNNNWKYIDEIKDIIEVKLEKSRFEKYPYIDNISYLNLDKKILSNDYAQFGDRDEIIELVDNIHGYYRPIMNSEYPYVDIKDIVNSWEDMVYIISNEWIIKYGIKPDFIEDYKKGLISDRLFTFYDDYDIDDIYDFIIKKENIDILKILEYMDFYIYDYIFLENNFSLDTINKLISDFLEYELNLDSREEQIEFIKDKLVYNKVELFESLLNVNLFSIKDFIKEKFKNKEISDNLKKEMVYITNHLEFLDNISIIEYVVDKLISRIDIEDEPYIRKVLYKYFDLDYFIENLRENGLERKFIIDFLSF